MLSTREVSDRLSVAYTTVMNWIAENKLPGAVKHSSPRGDYWMIPESAIAGMKKRGRGRPKKSSKKGSRK